MKLKSLLILLALATPLRAADFNFDVDTALSEVPVNIMPLVDDDDGVTIKGAVVFNETGLALRWHFVTSAGAYTVTSVTPTTGGAYDWTDQGDSGIYTIEIPDTGGASANNDTEGYGWFTGVATDIAPWRGPTICFRASGLNDALTDSAYSTTRGLAGTALPDAAADAAGGLVISDAGGFDIDNRAMAATSVTSANIVFTTDFATNYDTTNDVWNVDVERAAGTAWASGAITAASIATDAIGAAELAADSIGSSEIATGAITNAEFGADAITSAVIDDEAIDAATFVAGAIDAAAIGASAIGASEIATDAIGAAEIAADAITTAEIANDAITATEIATDAIGASEVAASALTKGTEIVGFNDLSAANVESEVLDGLTVTSGTADGGSTTTLLDAALTQADGYWDGDSIEFTSGTLNGLQAQISSWDADTDTMTFYTTLPATVGTHTYRILRTGSTEANVVGVNGATVTDDGEVPADVVSIDGAAVDPNTAQLGANVVNAGGTAWNSGAITANTLGANVLTAAKVAADVTTELLAPIISDSNAEPTTTPAANDPMITKLAWIFKGWRNGKSITSGELTLLNDNLSENIDWDISTSGGGTQTDVAEAAAAD